jgi:heme-degrading monooxygenase HmoA
MIPDPELALIYREAGGRRGARAGPTSRSSILCNLVVGHGEEAEVLAALRQIAGFRGAHLLRRGAADETEFVSLTFFEDIEAIRAFAGTDYEAAVVADEARRVLVRFDDRVVHYEVSAET